MIEYLRTKVVHERLRTRRESFRIRHTKQNLGIIYMDPQISDMLNKNPWMDTLMAQALSKATPQELQAIIDEKPAQAMSGSIIGISIEEKSEPVVNDEGIVE